MTAAVAPIQESRAATATPVSPIKKNLMLPIVFLGQTIKKTATTVGLVAAAIIQNLAITVKDTEGIYQVLRIAGTAIVGIQIWSGKLCLYEKLRTCLDHAEGMTEFLGTCSDIDGFVSGDYKKDTIAALASRVMIAAVNVAGFFMVLDEVRLVELGKIADEISKIPIFSFVQNIALGTVVQGGLVIYSLCRVADSIIRICIFENKADLIQAVLDLVHQSIEVVLKTFVLFGGSCVPVLVVLGIIAGSAGLIAFLYEKSQEEKINKKEIGVVLNH